MWKEDSMEVRARFWLEAVLAALTTALFFLTLYSRDWIEEIFHVEPDQGSGALEWLIVAALFVVSVAFIGAARAEWRRGRTSAS
jgi:hypothetical protein